MKIYPKIQTMFKRDMSNRGQIMEGIWSLPEFEYLKDNQWAFTEKVDGTNIRVMFNGQEIKYGGKTDNAQVHFDLIKRLQEIFEPKLELLKNTFNAKPELETSICFYGEGYGAGIQGGCYKQTKDFVLFDILIGQWWIRREDVEELAIKFGLDIVPIVLEGTLQDGIELVKKGYISKWGDFTAEGIVGKPKTELRTRSGDRLITKIKSVDFKLIGNKI